MAKKAKSKRIDKLMADMNSGSVLCKEFIGSEVRFWTEPGGKSVGPITVKKAIALELIRPSTDGLIEGANQTWVAK